MEEEQVDLKKVNPQQNTFNFENGIEISSELDSGNLLRCELNESNNVSRGPGHPFLKLTLV